MCPYYPYVVLYYFLPCKSRSTTCNLKISSHSVTSFANSKGKWCITMQFCLKLEWCIEFWGATQYRYVQFQEFFPHFLVFIYQKISPTDFSVLCKQTVILHKFCVTTLRAYSTKNESKIVKIRNCGHTIWCTKVTCFDNICQHV